MNPYQHPSAFDVHEAPTLDVREGAARPSVVDPLVLVVDDDEDGRAVYCASLAYLGYRTIERRDGALALEAAREHRPHAVLTDVAMPHLDGLEFTRRIRADEALRSTFVIVMTAFGGDRHAEALRAGCDVFLCKPFNPLLLEDILSARFDRLRDEVVKRCGCGREYTRAQWRELPLRGTMRGFELRNCPCGSTMALGESPRGGRDDR